MPPLAPGVLITLPVTVMLPPIAVLLIVKEDSCTSQVAAAEDVPVTVMLLAVIKDEGL